MYPGSIFNLHDQSAIPSTPPVVDTTYRPLFLSVGSFDKGVEGFNRVYGTNFYSMYGSKMYFSKHGQNAIQTANLINAGAECLIYRVVAEDSTLANYALLAKVTDTTVQKKNSIGQDIYIDINGDETTERVRERYQEEDSDNNPLYWADAEHTTKTTDSTHQEQDKDSFNRPLYWADSTHTAKTTQSSHIDPSSGETVANDPVMIEVDNEPVMIEVENEKAMVDAVEVSYTGKSYTNCTTYNEVKEQVFNDFSPMDRVYPVMFFTENGRGVSGKSIKISADYITSRSIGKMFYNAAVFEGTAQVESATVSFNPSVQYSNTAYGLSKSSLTQIYCGQIEEAYDAYIDDIANRLGVDRKTLDNADALFGFTLKGTPIANMIVNFTSSDIGADYGVALDYGSNGAFGDAPISQAYDKLMQAIQDVYDGKKDERIYDVDEYRIVAVLDANFKDSVKDSISKLASFRKDFMFFRDLGTDVTNYMEISEKLALFNPDLRDRYTTVNGTSYMVKDPVTFRNIAVTANYDIATCLVNHFVKNAFVPLAGQFNGFVLDSAIEGTTNFTPIITPNVDQKTAIDELRVNYAIFQGNQCTVQSEYTIQSEYTELSFTNNVIAIQEIMRAIRKYCPKIRFMTVDGFDMSAYAKAINDLLSNYTNSFYRLYFEYTADILKSSQKIFYATIKVQFRPWEQTEEFDIFALGLDANIETSTADEL